MPAPTTAPHFLDVVRKSGLIDSDKLAELSGSLNHTDPIQCATELVRTGHITSYQAKQLLAGKFRGFFLGTYKVMRPIGQGGMGTVYLADHTSLGRKVAIKVLTAEKAKDPLTLERFNREARAAAALDHPNIVRLHDISQGAGVHFLVMEYVDGTDLQSLMGQTGPLHYAQATQYIAQAAAGLQHAHDRGFIHRDVKPANLMLTKAGGIKILDMGLARSFNDSKDNLTGRLASGDIAGTVDFLSPEQAMNYPLDERTDIYSLGATFYALVTGHPPFTGSTAQKLMQHQMKVPPSVHRKLNGQVPQALSDVICLMMAKKPNDRYQTATDVIDALGPWLPAISTGNIVQDPLTTSSLDLKKQSATRPIRSSARLGLDRHGVTKPGWKRPIVLIAAAAVLLTSGIGAAVGLTIWGGEKKAETSQQLGTPPQQQQPPRLDPPAAQHALPRGYRLDLSQQKEFTRVGGAAATGDPKCDVRFVERQRTGSGDFPAGFERSTPYGEGHEAEYAARTVDGVTAFGQRNLKRAYPHGASVMFGPDMSFPGGKTRVRIDYRTEGVGETGCYLKFKPTEPVSQAWEVENGRLGGTDGQWKTIELDIPLRGATAGFFEMHNTSENPESWLWVKGFEAGAPTPAAGSPTVYRLDTARLKPFRKRIDFDISFGGPNVKAELPGWQYEVYQKDSDGEALAEMMDGRMAIAIGSRSGKASAQFSFQPVKLGTVHLVAGRVYEARLEYMADVDVTGVTNLQTINEWKIIGGTSLPATPSWKTVTFPVIRPEGKEVQFTFGTSNLCKGFLKIRSFEIVDPTGAVTTKPLIQYDLSSTTPFRKKFQDGMSEGGTGAIAVADEVFALCWKKTSVAEFRYESLDGKPAVGVTNLNDDLSSQIGFHLKSSVVAPGKKYFARVEYLTQNEAVGELVIQTQGDYRRFASQKLPNTSGKWATVDLPFVIPAEATATVLVENQSVGEGNTLLIRRVEVYEAK